VSLYIAGINGMVGSAIAEEARSRQLEVIGKSSKELDFLDRKATFAELQQIKPTYLIIAAAKVGGIGANARFPVDFLSINLRIQTNLLDAANAAGISKVLFLGSSCIYPKFASQPINEEYLLSGELESTNEPYAIAKIAGLKLVEAYRNQFSRKWISAMPTNLYGPKDNFDLENAHVLPALIHRIHKAKIQKISSVIIWGDGSPLREFLHSKDLARACLLLLDKYDDLQPINIGSGDEISIGDLAAKIASIIGYEGKLEFDHSKPNGTPRKLLNSRKLKDLGWTSQISLDEGIRSTYDWFLTNYINRGNV